MWWFRWHARRFFRSVMNPVDPQTARKWSVRLRFLYIIIAWNAMVISYRYYDKNKDKLKEQGYIEDVTPAHRKARLMSLGDVTIVRTGINRPTTTYSINAEEYSQEFHQKQHQSRQEYLKRKEMEEREEQLKNADNESISD